MTERWEQVRARQNERRAAAGQLSANGAQAELDARALRLAEQNPGDAHLREVAGQVEDRLRSN